MLLCDDFASPPSVREYQREHGIIHNTATTTAAAAGGMPRNSGTSNSSRRGSRNPDPATVQTGESSALDLAELLEKKDLSAAEVMVIRQNMVQVRVGLGLWVWWLYGV